MAIFQTKDFLSVVASCVNRVRATTQKITDFNPGSIVRVLIDAFAQEHDQLYQEMLHGLVESIPVAIYNGFGFPALTAEPASGLMLVTIAVQTSDVLIPAATQASTDAASTLYVTSADAVILAGNTTASPLIVAATAGLAGNLPSGAVFSSLSPAPSGFVSAVASGPLANGTDGELPAAQQARFAAYIAALPRGTLAALEYGLSLATIVNTAGLVTERVAVSLIVEPWLTDVTQHPGIVNVWVHNGIGSTSSALVTRAQAVLDGYTDSSGNPVPGWKAGGVALTVFAASDTALNVVVTISCQAAYAAGISAAAQAAVAAYILSLGIGGTFIWAKAAALIADLPGVTDCAVTTPSANSTAGATAKYIPGTWAATVTSV